MILLSTLLALVPLPAPGQQTEPDPSPTASTDSAVVGPPPVGSATAAGAGSVEQPLLPMSMRPFYHVFAAFGLAWLLIFVYAISVRRRMASLEEEVERLSR